MKQILTALYLVLLASCQSGSDSKTTETDSSILSNNNTATAPPTFDITPVAVKQTDLPASIRFRGQLFKAFKWNDKKGSNILVTSIVKPYDDKTDPETGDPGRTSELHAFHFTGTDTAYKLLWKISDAVRSCVFDITAVFIEDAITITDLDSNGIAETTIQYIISCRSDVSPDTKKLIMHEDTLKYTLRGLTCDPGTPNQNPCVGESDVNLEKQPPAKEEWEEYARQFGRYETEKNFAKAPAVFLDHARKQWLKHLYLAPDKN